jgi:hypothetical protein
LVHIGSGQRLAVDFDQERRYLPKPLSGAGSLSTRFAFFRRSHLLAVLPLPKKVLERGGEDRANDDADQTANELGHATPSETGLECRV